MSLDIGLWLVNTLRADAQYKALSGANTQDPRVYPYYEGGATIDPSTRRYSYITYAITGDPERLAATGGIVVSVAIWADTDVRAEAVKKRVLALVDCEGDPSRTITTPEGDVYQPVKVGSHWASQENTKFFGINLQFRFGFSHV